MDSVRTSTERHRDGRTAVGHVRVAECAQTGPSHRLDAQVATIRMTAEANGLELAQVFEDTGEPAHDLVRPGLSALLAAADAGQANVIIVPDLSRLAGDAHDFHRLMNLLDRRGVRLLSTAESLDTAAAAGRQHLRTLCRLASI